MNIKAATYKLYTYNTRRLLPTISVKRMIAYSLAYLSVQLAQHDSFPTCSRISKKHTYALQNVSTWKPHRRRRQCIKFPHHTQQRVEIRSTRLQDTRYETTLQPFVRETFIYTTTSPTNYDVGLQARIINQSIDQSCIFRVVQVIKSLQDPLEVGNNLPGINDNVRERGLE